MAQVLLAVEHQNRAGPESGAEHPVGGTHPDVVAVARDDRANRLEVGNEDGVLPRSEARREDRAEATAVPLQELHGSPDPLRHQGRVGPRDQWRE
jgi:hypothetical protein